MKLALVLAVAVLAAPALSVAGDARPTPAARKAPAPPAEPQGRVEVPPPPFSEGIFPCSNCHAGIEPNAKRRVLTEHTDIVLRHDEAHRWCLDCHDARNRDVLHLASGEPVPFEESYRLCGQCHGEKHRDWRAGVHGRRAGYWNGHKTYLLCAHCHNPHQPRFQPITPKPAPGRPSRTMRGVEASPRPPGRSEAAPETRAASRPPEASTGSQPSARSAESSTGSQPKGAR